MENQPKPLKTYKNRYGTMKNQSRTIKTNPELYRWFWLVQVVTGNSQEEVMIFRYRQTLHHNIYRQHHPHYVSHRSVRHNCHLCHRHNVHLCSHTHRQCLIVITNIFTSCCAFQAVSMLFYISPLFSISRSACG